MEQRLGEMESKMKMLQDSVNLLFEDRAILTDIQGSIKKLQSVQENNQVHQDLMTKDVKADIHDVHSEIKDNIVIVKTTRSLWQKVIQTLRHKKDEV